MIRYLGGGIGHKVWHLLPQPSPIPVNQRLGRRKRPLEDVDELGSGDGTNLPEGGSSDRQDVDRIQDLASDESDCEWEDDDEEEDDEEDNEEEDEEEGDEEDDNNDEDQGEDCEDQAFNLQGFAEL